jgi:hypothetical protein
MYRRLCEHLRQYFHPAEGAVPHDEWDFMHQFGNVVDALLYVPLFCPEFVEVEGSVLLSLLGRRSTSFVEAKRLGQMTLQELERSFNFVEIGYAFSDRARGTDDDCDLLAQFVADCWRGRLALLYPPRKFEVSVLSPSESRSVAAVQFCEIR